MSADSSRSVITDLKSKVDAICSLNVVRPQNPQAMSGAVRQLVNDVARLDFKTLANQLQNAGILKRMSFIPTARAREELLREMSDLLYVDNTPWPAEAEFRDHCAQATGPTRLLTAGAEGGRLRDAVDMGSVSDVALTEDEWAEAVALNGRVGAHNAFVRQLVSELTAKGAGGVVLQGENGSAAVTTAAAVTGGNGGGMPAEIKVDTKLDMIYDAIIRVPTETSLKRPLDVNSMPAPSQSKKQKKK